MKQFTFLLSLCFVFLIAATGLFAQGGGLDSLEVMDYSEQQEFEVGGIKVSGAFFAEENAIIGVTGLTVGSKIRVPGPDIPRAIRNLWRLRLFTNVQLRKEKSIGDVIFLEIVVEERPRLTRFSYKGAKKATHDDLNDLVNGYLTKGGIVTDNGKINAAEAVRGFFVDKGYLDAGVAVEEFNDSIRANSVRLLFDVDRGPRVKIKEINFIGNEAVKDKKLRKQFKETKKKGRFLASSKFLREEYEIDKNLVIAYYHTLGYRDARVVRDSLSRNQKGDLIIDIYIEEGDQYYFRNIEWKGNSIYDTETLSQILGIEKGDIYNEELLATRLDFSQDNRDVRSLYMDNGYLFFNVEPAEVAIEGDSIDLEIRIFEGPQATIDKVTIAGNDRTHEHVIRREVRTRPGDKFSRSDIIRSQREIINLGYFNPETLDIQTPVNPERGTVDINYVVEEKPSDQLELSAGWGGRGRGVIGTLGVTFNNFSLRNLFNRETWHPLPQGDGQRLSIRGQTNGQFFQSYNLTFTEPWLGGRKPTSLTVAAFINRNNFSFTGQPQKLIIQQVSASLGTRLRWPDDNFIFRTGLNIQTLSLTNWNRSFSTDDNQPVQNGNYNNFSVSATLARNTINDPLFPREGSNIELTLQVTPPYSAFRDDEDRDYSAESPGDRFRYLEYHKWRFNADWYTTIVGKLVFKAQAKIGVLGRFNSRIGTSPFERFQLGGDGINNQQFQFAGVDIISLRGYDTRDLPANINEFGAEVATPVFDKFTVELRYPLSLNPSSTIYGLIFAQGGNAWSNLKDFNPFDLKRSVGFGARVFLPMFGTLGFDYGIGFDKEGDPTKKGFGGLGTFNIVLGFEPE